jgi:hypothetical protein
MAVHGDGNVLDHLTLDAGKSVSRCTESIRLVFQSLKASPTTTIACAGEKVVLGGKVDNDVDKLARGQIAADFFQGVQVENNIEVVAPAN